MNQPVLTHFLLTALQVAPSAGPQASATHLTPSEWAALVALAQRHMVVPLLFARLKSHGWLTALPAPAQAALQRAYYENCVRNLQRYQQLQLILTHLQQQGIPVLVLKGAALATTVYADPTLRMMHDLDLLVDQAQLAPALAVLNALGYAFLEEPTAADQTLHHLPRLIHTDGMTEVELHWTLSPPDSYQPMDDAALWARAVSVELAGTTALVLSPTDQLLHLCLHASYHHHFQQGVRFLCDLDTLLRRQGGAIDWALVQAQVEQQGWGRGVYLALYLAEQLLAAPVPPAVLTALQPPAFEEQVVELAYWQIFAQASTKTTLSPAFADVWTASGLRQRFLILRQRFAMQQAFLARRHRVAPAHLRLTHYLPYYGGMLWRYLRHSWQLYRGDARALVATQRYVALTTWFENSEGKIERGLGGLS